MISKKNLTVIIVSFASDDVIYDCINSIDIEINIIVIENSNNIKLKNNLEKKYKNVKCFLNSTNSGMGCGNNLGLSKIKTDYAFILNPDVILSDTAIDMIIKASKNIDQYSILAPIHSNKNYPNYKTNSSNDLDNDLIDVDSVDGYAMLLNINRIKKKLDVQHTSFFDENIFMYLENDDLCKRLKNLNEKIFVIKSSEIKHLGAKGVNEIFKNEIELSRNWHWSWSRYYYKKKHFGFINAFINEFPRALSSFIKMIVYLFFNSKKKKIYFYRLSGFISSLLGRPSSLRPKIDISDLEN